MRASARVDLAAEFELLCACARTRVDAATAARIRGLVQSGLNWERLIDLASQHGIEPLLSSNLNLICPESVPPSALDTLRKHSVRHAQRNLFLSRELFALLELLEKQDIPAIPFKGPVLAAFAYGNLSLRQIADLDFIVHRRDVSRAKDVFLTAGFHLAHPIEPAHEPIFLRSNCEYTFLREHPHLVVDVHWQVAPQYFYFPFDLQRAWQRRAPVDVAGRTVLTLCPEDLLLYLCVHGARHVWERLEWICGVSELIRAASDLNWEETLGQAARAGGERILLLGLFLAERLLGTALPRSVVREIRADAELEPLAARITERLLQYSSQPQRVLQDTYVDELHPQMFKPPRARLRYYAHLVFTPTVSDAAALRLPRFLHFLYPLFRPVRLAVRFIYQAIKRKGANSI